MELNSVSRIIAYILTLSIIVAFGRSVCLFLRQAGVIKSKSKGRAPQPAGIIDKWAATIGLKTGLRDDDLKLVAGASFMVIVSRLLLYLIACLGVMLFISQAESLTHAFPLRWNRADSPFYINIARNWYSSRGDGRYLIVFYPLYPVLVRVASYLFRDYFFSGVAVSTFSLITACVYLYKLVHLDFDRQTAFASVKFLLIFPFSFLLGLAFPDSLLLALTVMTFYYLRRGKWFRAGLSGGLACLTHNLGILLLIPAGIEYLAVTGFMESLRRGNFRQITADLLQKGSFLLLIPSGEFVYLLINKLVTGDWFAFLTYLNGYWGYKFNVNIAANLQEYLRKSATWGPSTAVCILVPVIIPAFFAFLTAFYAPRKLRISYLAYLLLYLAVCLTTGWLAAGPRFLMGAFPIYLILALLAQKQLGNFAYTVFSGLTLCFYMIAFMLGLNVF